MQELQTFNFEELPVRTLEVDGEPYFVGSDIAKILGYQKTTKRNSDACRFRRQNHYLDSGHWF